VIPEHRRDGAILHGVLGLEDSAVDVEEGDVGTKTETGRLNEGKLLMTNRRPEASSGRATSST
jgi:hypothetical protein